MLIACCTASTVYERLARSEREVSIPIISPAARAAAKYNKIAVIATEATVRSRAFSREISALRPECLIDEIPTQRLVEYVERGARCGSMQTDCERMLDGLSDRIKSEKYDALVLGCTHFSHLEGEFQKRLPSVSVISPAREGAAALCKALKQKNKDFCQGNGRTVYIRS